MRSFIAIELPEAIKSSIADTQQELKKSGADIRWVYPDNIHLTLRFLGDMGNDAVDAVIQALKGTCSHIEPFTFDVHGIGMFPGSKSPRVLWIGIGNGGVARLHSEVAGALQSIGIEPEGRVFHPHLTLGRFRSSRGRRPLLDRTALLEDRSFGSVAVDTVSFMKSELRPEGARYTQIAAIPLTG